MTIKQIFITKKNISIKEAILKLKDSGTKCLIIVDKKNNLYESNTGAVFGIVFIMVGLAFKVSAVPFHMECASRRRIMLPLLRERGGELNIA